MRSFVPVLSAIVLFAPSSHAFHAPGTSCNSRRAATTASDGEDSTSSPLGRSIVASLAAATVRAGAAMPAAAVSGGGLDYAGLDISGQDFSNSGDYKGKDFTQVRYPHDVTISCL